VPKHTVLGIAQQVSEESTDKINAESESDSDRPLMRKKNEVLNKKLLPRKLDFVVEYRAGKKMAHVDALSRHVGTVVQGGTLEEEDVLREQAKDTFCLKQSPGTYASRKEFFRDDDGVLYRRRSKGEPQMIVSATLVHEVIMLNHDPVYVAHPGTKRTHDLIALQYWWPGMRKAIQDYVRKYDLCQEEKGHANL